jgi:hypothetical protein
MIYIISSFEAAIACEENSNDNFCAYVIPV